MLVGTLSLPRAPLSHPFSFVVSPVSAAKPNRLHHNSFVPSRVLAETKPVSSAPFARVGFDWDQRHHQKQKMVEIFAAQP